MALKADRYEESTDISFFYNDDVATRGGVVVLDAVLASGAAMDQGGNKVKYKKAKDLWALLGARGSRAGTRARAPPHIYMAPGPQLRSCLAYASACDKCCQVT